MDSKAIKTKGFLLECTAKKSVFWQEFLNFLYVNFDAM